MTYYITGHKNDRSRLCVNRTETTDAAIADMIAAELERRGLIVHRWVEG